MKGLGYCARKDIEFLLGDFIEGIDGESKVFCKDFDWGVRHPIAYKEGFVFGEIAVVEYKEELAAIWAEALDGVREAGGEEPEVALFEVIDKVATLGVDCSDADIAIEDDGPFVGAVPMEFSDATIDKAHIDACDCCGDGKIFNGYLSCPAPFLETFVGTGKREPEIIDVPAIG